MRHRTVLKRFQIVNLWNEYNKSFNIKRVAKDFGLCYSAGLRYVNIIKSVLAGEKLPIKKRRWIEMNEALKIIKKQEVDRKNGFEEINYRGKPVVDTNNPPTVGTVETITVVESTELKINRLQRELLEAMADYAIEQAEAKYKPILEEAQKSNIVGLLNRRLHAAG